MRERDEGEREDTIQEARLHLSNSGLTGDGKDACEGDEGARFCACGASDFADGEWSRREQ